MEGYPERSIQLIQSNGTPCRLSTGMMLTIWHNPVTGVTLSAKNVDGSALLFRQGEHTAPSVPLPGSVAEAADILRLLAALMGGACELSTMEPGKFTYRFTIPPKTKTR